MAQETCRPNDSTSNAVTAVVPIDHSSIDVVGTTCYSLQLPKTAVSVSQHYGVESDSIQPFFSEENNIKCLLNMVVKENDVAKPSAKLGASLNVDRPPRFPRKACVVYKDEQYSLDAKLLSLPRATKYLVKVRTEISPGRFMAKLVLHCAR